MAALDCRRLFRRARLAGRPLLFCFERVAVRETDYIALSGSPQLLNGAADRALTRGGARPAGGMIEPMPCVIAHPK
jgi:hypothetical protein